MRMNLLKFSRMQSQDISSIIETTSKPLVSPDFNHNPHSSIIDISEIKVLNNNFAESYLGMITNGILKQTGRCSKKNALID